MAVDPVALNFDADANVDDGSCVEIVLGCMDSDALNYNPNANTDNGLWNLQDALMKMQIIMIKRYN